MMFGFVAVENHGNPWHFGVPHFETSPLLVEMSCPYVFASRFWKTTLEKDSRWTYSNEINERLFSSLRMVTRDLWVKWCMCSEPDMYATAVFTLDFYSIFKYPQFSLSNYFKKSWALFIVRELSHLYSIHNKSYQMGATRENGNNLSRNLLDGTFALPRAISNLKFERWPFFCLLQWDETSKRRTMVASHLPNFNYPIVVVGYVAICGLVHIYFGLFGDLFLSCVFKIRKTCQNTHSLYLRS